jgi:hypothetical protein
MRGADEGSRWRLVAEFLEEYRWESPEGRGSLLEQEPEPTGDEHWDVFLAALAEPLAARDGQAGSVVVLVAAVASVLVSVQHSGGSGGCDRDGSGGIP